MQRSHELQPALRREYQTLKCKPKLSVQPVMAMQAQSTASGLDKNSCVADKRIKATSQSGVVAHAWILAEAKELSSKIVCKRKFKEASMRPAWAIAEPSQQPKLSHEVNCCCLVTAVLKTKAREFLPSPKTCPVWGKGSLSGAATAVSVLLSCRFFLRRILSLE